MHLYQLLGHFLELQTDKFKRLRKTGASLFLLKVFVLINLIRRSSVSWCSSRFQDLVNTVHYSALRAILIQTQVCWGGNQFRGANFWWPSTKCVLEQLIMLVTCVGTHLTGQRCESGTRVWIKNSWTVWTIIHIIYLPETVWFRSELCHNILKSIVKPNPVSLPLKKSV